MKKYVHIIFFFTLISQYVSSQNVEIIITDATGLYSQDGKIVAKVDPGFGLAPYTFSWAGQTVLPPTVFDPIGEPVQAMEESEITELNPGTYCVTITAGSGCKAHGCFDVEVCQGSCLNANYIYQYDVVDGCAVHFIETCSGSPSNYTWDFGDGGMAFEPNPTHIFNGPGCYNVELTVEGGGEISSVVQEVWVYSCNNEGEMHVEIDGPTYVVAGGSPQEYEAFVYGGEPPYTYTWDWSMASENGNGAGPYSVTFSEEAPHTFLVTVTDSEGSTTENSLPITAIDMEVDIWNSLAIINQPTSFIGEYNIGAIENFGNETFDWNFGDGTTIPNSPFSIQSHTYNQIGPHTVTFTVNDGSNSYSASKTIQVYESYSAAYPASEDYCLYTLVQDAAEPFPSWSVIYSPCACTAGSHSYSPIVFQQDPNNAITFSVSGFDTDCGPNDPDSPCGNGFPPGGSCFKGHVELENVETGRRILIPGDDPNGPDPYLLWWNVLQRVFFNVEIGDDWGCWNLIADTENVAGAFREGFWECIAYVEPDELVISEIEVVDCPEGSGCDGVALRPIIEGGGFHRANVPSTNCESCSGNNMKVYESYEWKLFSINSENLIDEGILDMLGPGNCAKVNYDHPYFDNFIGANEAEFIVAITVTDFLGYSTTYGQEITVPMPLQFDIPDEFKVPGTDNEYEIYMCPGTVTWLGGYVGQPIVYGGTGSEIPTIDPGSDFMQYFPVEKTFKIDLTGVSQPGPHQAVIDWGPCMDNITIWVHEEDLVAHPGYNVLTCVGPSMATLGDGNLSASNGSGQYEYSWTPTTGLSDPTIANPLVYSAEPGYVGVYTLTVTDIKTGCTASADVHVSATSSDPLAIVDPASITLCHGEAYDLGATAFGGYVYNPLYQWESNHPVLPLDPNDQALVFTEEVTSVDPGTYEFIFRVIDPFNGCYDEAIVDVEILPQWRYSGYESEVVFATGDNFSGTFWGEKGKGNILYTSEHPTIVSGAELPITYGILENISSNLYNVTVNNNAVPENGIFSTSIDHPFLTLRMQDANGCTEDFMTNRHLLLDFPDNPPELSIDLYGSNNSVVCENDQICFLVKLKTNYIGWNEWLLPPSLEFDYSIEHYTSTLNTVVEETGTLELDLINPGNGTYAAQFCYDANSGGIPLFYSTFVISGELGPDPLLALSADYQFYIGQSGTVQLTSTVCNGEHFRNAIQLSVNPNNCNNGFYLNPTPPGGPPNWNDGVYLWKGGNGGFVDMEGLITSEGGYVEHLHAFISQCMEEQLLPNEEPELRVSNEIVPDERTPSGLTLEVHPNPFSGELTIRYSILSDQDETPVSIKVMDATGKLLHMALSNELHFNGNYSMSFDGNRLSPGIYFIQMDTGLEKLTEKVFKIN